MDDIDPQITSEQTLFFLCDNTYDGFPVGCNKGVEDCILLDSGENVSFQRLKQLFNEKKISSGITLDFNSNERLLNGIECHSQFDYMTQQMAKINFQTLKQTYILDYLAGQYILLDFGNEWLLPIYVLNDKYIRAQSHIIHIHDLQNYVQMELENGDFIRVRMIFN